jgi:hypothetical protein
MPPTSDIKSPEQVKEVADFLEAFRQVEAFKEQHSDVFAQYEVLARQYNQKLEAAEKICRQQRVTCGPFELYQFSTVYDAKILYDMIGHDMFFRVGGNTKQETVYGVDKAKVKVAIEQGTVPSDVVEAFRKVTPSFHKPEKIST